MISLVKTNKQKPPKTPNKQKQACPGIVGFVYDGNAHLVYDGKASGVQLASHVFERRLLPEDVPYLCFEGRMVPLAQFKT